MSRVAPYDPWDTPQLGGRIRASETRAALEATIPEVCSFANGTHHTATRGPGTANPVSLGIAWTLTKRGTSRRVVLFSSAGSCASRSASCYDAGLPVDRGDSRHAGVLEGRADREGLGCLT